MAMWKWKKKEAKLNKVRKYESRKREVKEKFNEEIKKRIYNGLYIGKEKMDVAFYL